MTATEQRPRLEFRVSLPLDSYAAALTLIVLTQACWLGYFASRGWFYADDLSYLSEATGRSLDWNYLTAPLNDHFVPGLKLVFWIMNRTTRLDYGTTVLFRVVLQAITTILLNRLLILLVGRRPGVLAVITWYAFGPLLMPGAIWLTTSVHLMSAQLLVILAIDLHVRYAVTGRLRQGVASSVCLLAAMTFWELSGITALLLPLLSLTFVHSGRLADRVRASLRRWAGWSVLAVLLIGWLLYFSAGHYGGSAHAFGMSDAVQVLKVGWLDTLTPALFGGPWQWFAYGDIDFSVAAPSRELVIAAQVLLAVLLLVSLWRTGRRALVAWALPLITFVIGTVVVAVGRFWIYGDLTPRSFNYAFILAVPVTLGAALALLPSTSELVAARALGEKPAVPANYDLRLMPRFPLVAIGGFLVLLLVSSMVSETRFADRWAQNPSQRYMKSLIASVRAAGPKVNLWDGRVPSSVLAVFSYGNHISDVLHLAGVPARYQDPGSDPMIVRDDGTLAPAGLYQVAAGVQQPHTPCTKLIQGAGSWNIPLSTKPTVNEYFLKISYLQQQPSTLYVGIRDDTGAIVAPTGGQRTALNDQLGNVYFRLPLMTPRSLVLRSESIDTTVCIGAVQLGVPFPQPGK